MRRTEENFLALKKEQKALRNIGNKLYKEQMNAYGQLRGFKKPISILQYD